MIMVSKSCMSTASTAPTEECCSHAYAEESLHSRNKQCPHALPVMVLHFPNLKPMQEENTMAWKM